MLKHGSSLQGIACAHVCKIRHMEKCHGVVYGVRVKYVSRFTGDFIQCDV